MTAFADVDSAVAAMKAGAYHFLTKPFHSNDAVAHACSRRRPSTGASRDQAQQLEQALLSKERFGEIIGDSPSILEVFRLIEGVAPTSSTVAHPRRERHGQGARRARHPPAQPARQASRSSRSTAAPSPRSSSSPSSSGTCAGAFTGAQTARAGLFESADGGTILLDEVGDLPLAAQVKLLRVLQDGEIKRVGADETRTVDVRVLAATNVDLVDAIQAGRVPARPLLPAPRHHHRCCPPLRDRGDDVLLLANYFLQKFGRSMQREPKRLSPDAARALCAYDWPGNVRELEHAIEHAVVLSGEDVIGAADLPFARPHSLLEEPGTMPGLGPASDASRSRARGRRASGRGAPSRSW